MGAMRGEVVAQLEEHLGACGLCRHRLRETKQFLSVFRAAAAQLESQPRVPSRGLLLLVAATVAAALLLMFVVTTGQDTSAPLPATVIMESMRGLERGAHIPAGSPSVLVFDAAPAVVGAEAQVEIVDRAGKRILMMPGKWNKDHLTATVGKLAPGSYWVRVYSKATKDLVAEYGLEAE
jgi:hypothetical protein